MLNCGIVSCIVRLVSIAVGLRWGVMGVAAATAAWASLVVPFEVWYCCRRGPVRVLEFVPTFLYLTALGLTVAATVSLTRVALGLSHPILGIGVTLAAVAAVMPFALCLHRQGRELLANVIRVLRRQRTTVL